MESYDLLHHEAGNSHFLTIDNIDLHERCFFGMMSFCEESDDYYGFLSGHSEMFLPFFHKD